MANAAGLNANADLAGAGIGVLFLDELKLSACCGDLDGAAGDWGHVILLCGLSDERSARQDARSAPQTM